MDERPTIVEIDAIEPLILVIRGKRVILDADLARLYGTSTKRLNEQVRRNRDRFPEDFAFQISKMEKMELVAICDRFKKTKHSTALPLAFTEHGAIMAASVLNTTAAVQASVLVVRAFVRMKEMLAVRAAITSELESLKRRVDVHDVEIENLINVWQSLIEPTHHPARRIGFRANRDEE